VESRGEREREDIPQDQGGKDGQDHEARGSAEHKLTLVSLHYKGIPRIEEEYHGIYQTAH
jgi:hypothetical protein